MTRNMPEKPFKLADLVYEITTEDGIEKMTLAQYHKRPELMAKIGYQANPPLGRNTVFMGTQIFSFSKEALKSSPRLMENFVEAERLVRENPLKYFVPQSQTVLDFLNWKVDEPDSTFKILLAGNGAGKSVAGFIDVMLEILPCDKSWPIFQQHGVKWREYRGPYEKGGVAVISYELKNHETTLWPQVIRRWCPKEYIKPYIEGSSTIAWARSPKIEIAGTPLFFLVTKQSQAAFESQALNLYWWDEQGDEARFNGANARVRRLGGRHVQSMTPHAIEGRPDTGAGSYIHRMYKGELDVGCNTRFFEMSINGLPDWVFREEDKAKAIREWIEDPIKMGNKKKLAEGLARVHGKFHERSGLVFDEFQQDIHMIPRFEVPAHWTRYRYHDHGRKEANACLLIAVNEDNDIFIVDEYYEKDREIKDNAVGIIEMCGNDRTLIKPMPNEMYRELMTGNDIVRTVSDSRSLAKKMDGSQRTIQQEYLKHGIFMVPGSGMAVDQAISIAAGLWTLDYKRKHYYTKQNGAPRCYVFNDLEHFKKEILGYRMRTFNKVQNNTIVVKEKPVAENDHLMTCFMLMGIDNPVYIPKRHVDPFDEKDNDAAHEDNDSDIGDYWL